MRCSVRRSRAFAFLMTIKLPILHFNDVYRVQPQKLRPGSPDTIEVSQFAAMLDDIRAKWGSRDGGRLRDGLVLFSGDVFSPSVESSVTRGSHMVPVMNELAPDVSLVGNHDFDFGTIVTISLKPDADWIARRNEGYPHLSKLIKDTKFPWILSNIYDEKTSQVPDILNEFYVTERSGVRIGVIGLVEKEWIGTVSSWPPNFKYKDMADTGRKLSRLLRDPQGSHKCDILIALTHSRIPNDITLAKQLFALSPAEQGKQDIAYEHGVDILFGGHDHLYYASKGVTRWENFDINETVLGAENDNGDVLVIKSGTDFRELSEMVLELEDNPSTSIRRKVIKSISGKRHITQSGSKKSEKLAKILEKLLNSVSSALKAPVCKSEAELDVRSQMIRTKESAAGNWFADVVRHSYDDALCMRGCGGSDGVLVCAGTFRGDSVYGPGDILLGDILEILPFEDPLVVLEVDGETIWAALEASLETWPAQEGRFPVISGFRVSWDSRKPPGQRVLGIYLLREVEESKTGRESDGRLRSSIVDGAEIKREKGGKMYKLVTREYMAQGHDGFSALKGNNYLVDDENGQMYSTLVRKYLLGSQFVNKMSQTTEGHEHLQESTHRAIEREMIRRKNAEPTQKSSHVVGLWHRAAAKVIRANRSKVHYQDHINVSTREHMSGVDCFDGERARTGVTSREIPNPEDLLSVNPVVDGRLKDEGRE